MSSGHRITLGKSVTIKDGKIVRTTRVIAGQPRKVAEARAAKDAAKWVAKGKRKP
jgi:hypothetical protein